MLLNHSGWPETTILSRLTLHSEITSASVSEEISFKCLGSRVPSHWKNGVRYRNGKVLRLGSWGGFWQDYEVKGLIDHI